METLTQFLDSYDDSKYKSPSVTVDIAIYSNLGDSLNLLLIKRKNHPNIDKWALPGGFIEMDETLTEAASRELFEETSQKARLYSIGFFGEPTRDPRKRIITAGFTSLVKSDALTVKAGDDAKEADLFRVELAMGSEIDIPERQTADLITLPCSNSGYLPARGRECTLTLTGPDRLISRLAISEEDGIITPVLLESELASDHALIALHALLFLKDARHINIAF